jgi:hypothetical protein
VAPRARRSTTSRSRWRLRADDRPPTPTQASANRKPATRASVRKSFAKGEATSAIARRLAPSRMGSAASAAGWAARTAASRRCCSCSIGRPAGRRISARTALSFRPARAVLDRTRGRMTSGISFENAGNTKSRGRIPTTVAGVAGRPRRSTPPTSGSTLPSASWRPANTRRQSLWEMIATGGLPARKCSGAKPPTAGR